MSGSSNENASGAEKIEGTPSENTNIEKADAGNSETVFDESVNAVESQGNGEIIPAENATLEMEEDQVIVNRCLLCLTSQFRPMFSFGDIQCSRLSKSIGR